MTISTSAITADLPIYRSGAGTGYSIAFWIKAARGNVSGKLIYAKAVPASGYRQVALPDQRYVSERHVGL